MTLWLARTSTTDLAVLMKVNEEVGIETAEGEDEEVSQGDGFWAE